MVRFMLMALVFLGGAVEGATLLPATFTESASGACTVAGPDSATGVSDAIPESVNVDLQFSNFTGSCQSVVQTATYGGYSPGIDLQLSGNVEFIQSAAFSATGTATGRLIYKVVVSGPEGTTVNMNIAAAVSLGGTLVGTDATDWMQARGWVLGLPGAPLGGIDICSYWGDPTAFCQGGAGPVGGAEQSLFYQTAMVANFVYTIDMYALGRISAFAGSPDEAASSADLQVAVDPTFSFVNPEDAELYTLEFSPNLAVPLPPVALLFPAGLLAGLGWLRRQS